MPDKQYIVTEIQYSDGTMSVFKGKQIDNNDFLDLYEPENGICRQPLEIGDIVDVANDGSFKKKIFTDCEKATVINMVRDFLMDPNGALISRNVVFAFCAKYGDIQIALESPYRIKGRLNSFLNIKSGDEILVREKKDTENIKYEIVANLTANKARKDFLIRNR